jgi:hypothetical protein
MSSTCSNYWMAAQVDSMDARTTRRLLETEGERLQLVRRGLEDEHVAHEPKCRDESQNLGELVPGRTALTRTPVPAHSSAAVLVSPTTPCFDATE